MDELHPEMFVVEAATGKMYRNGFDQHGRPVAYMRPRLENTKDWDNQVRHLVYTMERLVDSMDPAAGVESWVWIFDFHGMSYSTSVPISIGRQIVDILGTSYPERLGVAYMVDAPYIFSFFWAAISPLLHPVTKSKVKFCSSTRSGAKADPAFLENFKDPSSLEADFGGSLESQYDHRVYWDNERAFLAARSQENSPTAAAAANADAPDTPTN